MNETSFDIFSGEPDEHAVSVEAVQGLSNAQQRIGQSAAQEPGKYYLFSPRSRSIFARMRTFSKT